MVRRIVDETREKSGMLTLGEPSDGFNPDSIRTSDRSVSIQRSALLYLARQRRDTLALNECIAVDLFRDQRYKRKKHHNQAKVNKMLPESTAEIEQRRQVAQDALLAAQ